MPRTWSLTGEDCAATVDAPSGFAAATAESRSSRADRQGKRNASRRFRSGGKARIASIIGPVRSSFPNKSPDPVTCKLQNPGPLLRRDLIGTIAELLGDT